MVGLDKIDVAIAYVASDGNQIYQEISLPVGTSIFQALMSFQETLSDNQMASFFQWCVDNQDHDPNHKAWYVGIYSQKKRLDTVLSDGDRVEIYRPLSDDPMMKRKARSKS